MQLHLDINKNACILVDWNYSYEIVICDFNVEHTQTWLSKAKMT